MRILQFSLSSATGLLLALPAGAQIVYSNLQDITIPANFAGVYLDINTGNWNNDANNPQVGWDINPFFGGSVLWNSPGFQPVRSGTTETSSVVNLSEGAIVGNLSTFSTFVQGPTGENPGGPGYGISETHMGNGDGQFVSGNEGYLGFRLNGNYGWMRVVLTNNGAGALIKEWAYDTSGAQIATANIKRVGSNVTLDSTYGAFTVSSAITDSLGAVNLVKQGGGVTTLTGASNYSGTTTVSDGTLLVNGNNASATGAVSVGANGTLGGTGTIGGAVNVTGVLSPGASIETLGTGTLSFAGGSSLVHELNSGVSTSLGSDLLKVSGDLNLAGEVGLNLSDIAGSPVAFNVGDIFSLINYTGSWNNGLFTLGGNELADEEVFTLGLNTWRISYNDATGGLNYAGEYLGGSDSFVNLHAVPEPRAALLGLLSLLMLLRRRR